jgi:hypothetical protein
VAPARQVFINLPIYFYLAPKSNSEFIYYGKYNKELARPRSYSKQTGGGDCSDFSQEGKNQQAASNGKGSKNLSGSACHQNSNLKGKKPSKVSNSNEFETKISNDRVIFQVDPSLTQKDQVEQEMLDLSNHEQCNEQPNCNIGSPKKSKND